MAWTTPRTWAVGEAITADLLNEQLRDNLSVLKDPGSANYEADETGDYTTTSSSFVDVDATNLALTIETNGGDVLVHFHGSIKNSNAGGIMFFDIDVDGTRHGGDDGCIVVENPDAATASQRIAISFTRLITGLAAGSHTFKLQWKRSAGTITLYAGAGSTNGDVHPQFWAREVS